MKNHGLLEKYPLFFTKKPSFFWLFSEVFAPVFLIFQKNIKFGVSWKYQIYIQEYHAFFQNLDFWPEKTIIFQNKDLRFSKKVTFSLKNPHFFDMARLVKFVIFSCFSPNSTGNTLLKSPWTRVFHRFGGEFSAHISWKNTLTPKCNLDTSKKTSKW